MPESAAAGDRCPIGGPRCPESICDCFIATHPDNPIGLHPEMFAVRTPTGWHVPDPVPGPTCYYPGCNKTALLMNEGGLWCEHPHSVTASTSTEASDG